MRIFDRGRHIYTFENICREDRELFLEDGTTKIFLNADGKMNDISKELKAFLDYVAGKKVEDSFVMELEKAVKNAKRNRKWRHEYMTLLMRDQENLERGREEGRKEGERKGEKKGMRGAAKRMLAAGKYTLDEIADISGLSLKEVENLMKKTK